jgi:sterol 3beta-glucosyltransferase
MLAGLRDRITPEAQERRKQHHARAVIVSPSVQLDDPMESRVLDSLQYQDQPVSLAAHPGFKPSRPLHITCLTIGSRGDVQPYIAFCKRLMQDGHTCRIATHGEYKYWIESHGIEFGHVGVR